MTGLLLALLLVPSATAPPDSQATIRRFALLVGANDGGSARVRLRYAHSDAASLDRVLRELGGLAEGDRLLVLDPPREDLLHAFSELRARVAAAGNAQREVIFYYSGHADADGLLLPGGDRLPYTELRAALEGIPAEVRIAILDSCASGSFTRLKGSTPRPSFLSDVSNLSRGHAFLTSSSGDEAAQESDQIGSSFFTHFLVSGLRGAADATGDGRITLLEAYQFAFRETLARTEASEAGAQHPGYAIDMVGTGDLVMTDLRNTSAGVRLGETLSGRLFVRDSEGQLVAELHKSAGHSMELALAPGIYELTLERDGRAYRARLSVPAGAPLVVEDQALSLHELEPTRSRGAAPDPLRHVPFDLSLVPPLSINGAVGGPVFNNFELGALVSYAAALDGVGVSGLVSVLSLRQSGLSVAGLASFVGGRAGGGQVAGLADVVTGELHGVQVAGVADWVSGDATGLQVAGAASVVEGSLHGAQVAGAVSVAGRSLDGAQLAGALNVADQLSGLQLSPINIAGSVHGAQIGVINIASEVKGTQIGVINVAGTVDGAPLGVISVAGNGRISGEVWIGDSSAVNLGVKIGLRHLYTLLTASLDPGRAETPWYVGGGLGWRRDFGRFYLTVDATTGDVGLAHSPDPLLGENSLSKVRLSAGWAFADRLAVFVGVSANVWVLWRSANPPDLSYGLSTTLTSSNSPTQVRFWPAPYAGVAF